MPSILRSDVKRLMGDIEKIEKDMETLQRDCLAWTGDIQNMDLEDIIKHIRELEWDFNATMTDNMMMGRQFWKESSLPVTEGLGWSSVYMACIYNDLKDMKKGFQGSNIGLSLFIEFYIDWEKFKKSVYYIQRLVCQPQERRKNFPWLAENDGKWRQE